MSNDTDPNQEYRPEMVNAPPDKVPFRYVSGFMNMQHNYLCAVCKAKSAVQDCNSGILQPCWGCQALFTKIRKKNWIERMFK